jgi:hypothetical protein
MPKNSHNPLQILLHLPRDETVPLQGDTHEDEAGRAGEEHGNLGRVPLFGCLTNKQKFAISHAIKLAYFQPG